MQQLDQWQVSTRTKAIEDNMGQYNISILQRSLHKPYTFMKLQDYLFWYALKFANHDAIQCATKLMNATKRRQTLSVDSHYPE